ncbi:MAG: NAD(P)/FAD-dependent oxidoreductase, partial [Chloroflexi bacterium]|nr:NAD(P)/FAD-dependent oxidoreductase [Chloroflexota bacterium]
TQRSPRILKEYDREISEAVHEALAAQGMNFVIGASFKRAEKGSGGYRLTVEVGGASQVLEAEQILVAAGRQPNTSALKPEQAGIALGKQGEIAMDEYLRTTNPRVFAAGDVTLAPQFVYVAAYQGTLAAENALNNAGLKADLRVVPAVIFTTPSVATVGLTEQQAKAAGYNVKTSILPAKYVPRALVNREAHGVFKMVAQADTNRILGVQVVAENAGEVIYAATLAIKFNLTIQDLTSTFDPYLTMAEGLKLVAKTFDKDVAKLSCCA